MADQKFTRCPGCGTVFRITLAQLALREGQVRCGHCRAVFDANDHFVALAADQHDDETGLQDELAMGRPTVTLRSADALLPLLAEPDPIANPIESREPAPGNEAVDMEASRPELAAISPAENVGADAFDAAGATSDDATVTETPADDAPAADGATGRDAPGDAVAVHETTDDTTADESTPGALTDDERGAAFTGEPLEDAEPVVAQPVDAATSPPVDVAAAPSVEGSPPADAAPSSQVDASPPVDAVAPPQVDAAASPPVDGGERDRTGRFEWKKPQRRSGRSPFVDGIAIVLLLVALALQGVLEFRDALAAHLPVTRPLLATACEWLGCAVGPLRDTAALSIDASDLQADPAHRGLLLLTATIRNRAAYAIALPYLELSLTDSSDRVVVRRAFPPSEYADGTDDPSQGIAANGEKLVRLFIDASATAQAGYRLYLFYP